MIAVPEAAEALRSLITGKIQERFEQNIKTAESIAKDNALAAVIGPAIERPQKEAEVRLWLREAHVWKDAASSAASIISNTFLPEEKHN